MVGNQGLQGLPDKPISGLVYLPQPVRFLDTRSSGVSGSPCNTPATPLAVGSDNLYNVRTICTGIPEDARGIFGNITCVNNAGNGFLTMYPNSNDLTFNYSTPTSPVTNRPFVATTNYRTSGNPNQTFNVAIGKDSQFWIYNASTGTTVDVILDIVGYVL